MGDKIAAIMGVEAGAAEKMVAFVKCKGTCDKANVQYNYYGMDDCVKIAAAVPGAGDKACSYGCLGSGSCVKACQFDAIHIVDLSLIHIYHQLRRFRRGPDQCAGEI